MKRILALLLASILLITYLAGCAASQTKNGEWDGSATTAATTTAGSWNNDGSGMGGNPTAERKIIRDASIDLEVIDVIKAYDAILGYAKQYGGYETNRTQQRSDSYISISAQIKIKPDQLDAFIAFIGTQGKVINTRIDTEDITESYYDTQTRLKSMEAALQTYYDFLDKAANIQESLAVQSQINQLTTEIESLKGRLKLWESLLSESIVTVLLRQIEDPVKIKKEINWSTLSFADMAYLMQSGLTNVLNFLVNAVQWLAIALVVTVPLWIAALIILIVLLRRRKKRRLAQKKPADVQEAEDQPKDIND